MNTPIDRLLSKVAVDADTGCWRYTAFKTRKGYGVFSYNSKPCVAHRVAYLLLKGPIPYGCEIDHLCRNRDCCNPDHLEPVSHGENVRRGLSGAASSARAGLKTHCPQGHEYTPDNTRMDAGVRRCKQCSRERRAKYCQRDPEKIKHQKRRHYDAHRDAILDRGRDYYQRNRERLMEAQRNRYRKSTSPSSSEPG